MQKAIAGLVQEDRVVPVRLALFAEMVKGKPWSPETLREMGGAEGVGVTFLEETFSARTANPRYRLHEEAVRAVLGALLPARGTDIRGRVCSNAELLDISGYGKKPRAFKELMRILDSETRLLTPMDLDAIDSQDLRATPGSRYYQLTHDYLVPSLRQWLTAKQRSTRSGRLELRLEERSRLWNANPEGRQLPSLLEWFSIRLLTRRSRWTAGQRRVMRAASRRHLRSLLAVAALLLVILVAGSEVTAVTRNLLVGLRARTAAVSMALGMDSAVWSLLRPSSDPSLRTAVIHGLSPMVTSPTEVITKSQTQEDVGIRRAMMLVAGELVGPLEDQSARSTALRKNDPQAIALLQLFRDDPDPGIHAAVEWTLQFYQYDAEMAQINRELASTSPVGERQWYVNAQGHTFVVIPGPTQFMMGTPNSAADRAADEPWHSQRIRRSFCLASCETTVEQFDRFLRDRGGALIDSFESANAPGDSPRANVSWYAAAAYCNWLSEREGLPEDQWCYVPNAEGKYGPGMRIAAEFPRSPRLPVTHGGRMGVRLSRGICDQSLLRGQPVLAGPLCRVSSNRRRRTAAGGHPQAERLRTLRYAGQRGRMVPGHVIKWLPGKPWERAGAWWSMSKWGGSFAVVRPGMPLSDCAQRHAINCRPAASGRRLDFASPAATCEAQ